jgi:hypothetical protein
MIALRLSNNNNNIPDDNIHNTWAPPVPASNPNPSTTTFLWLIPTVIFFIASTNVTLALEPQPDKLVAPPSPERETALMQNF